jgi:lipopolysaccharide/colanic/teichoic acid biosynthesis glycosyltransferase
MAGTTMTKRIFDIAAATLGLILLAPIMALLALLIRLDSPGPALFRQQRVGRGFKPFVLYKFRTMTDGSAGGRLVTVGRDARVTRIGAVLRRTKLDELPQLVNVVRGDMSLVGPRPEVPRYVDLFHAEYAEVLQVRPGITDPASIKYRDEESILGLADDADEEYLTRILPDKLRLSADYARSASLSQDFALILHTVFSVAVHHTTGHARHS